MRVARLVLGGLLALAPVTSSGSGASAPQVPWWQRAVIYQVYPRSFQDSDGDGVGDLRGIVSRLDYLHDLGVNAIWVSPFYPSPMRDFGYDIADYTGVDPLFGKLADFDALVAGLHHRGMRLILDLVPNHTSDAHPWFQEARASKNNPKRGWYIWRDPAAGGGPPNNWRSVFGGSAWAWDQGTGQYFYHAFLREQPDLNWRTPAVRAAMYEVMRFWLARGVDGFRVDAVAQLIEDEGLRDEPLNPRYRAGDRDYDRNLHPYTEDQPEVHGILAEMRRILDSFGGDRVLIVETYLPFARLSAYYGTSKAPEAHLPFNFHLLATPWNPAALAAVVSDYEASLPGWVWPNWVLGNHDVRRLASRIGEAQLRVAAMMLLTLRGTPTLYYGDELGMRDLVVTAAEAQDPLERLDPGKGMSRDPERAPMPWDASANGGFSRAKKTWLPLVPQYLQTNVATQTSQRTSLLVLYRELLRLRRQESALALGGWRLVAQTPEIFAYERLGEGSAWLVALNLSATPTALDMRERRGAVVLSTYLDQTPRVVEGRLSLRGNEGVIIKLK